MKTFLYFCICICICIFILLTLLVKFCFIISPLHPISCRPDNGLRCKETEKERKKPGNRKTGKDGGELAEGESPEEDEMEEGRCNPKTESMRIFLKREVLVVYTYFGLQCKPLLAPGGEFVLKESPTGSRDIELPRGPHRISTQGSRRSPNKSILPSIPVHRPTGKSHEF